MKNSSYIKEMFKQLNIEHMFDELTTDDVNNISKSMFFFAWKASQVLILKQGSQNILDMLTGKKPKPKPKLAEKD